MKEPRVRLLYPPSVTREEMVSALRGMERFNRFGVISDEACLSSGKIALKGVTCSGSISRIVAAPSPVTPFDMRINFSEVLFPRDIIPIGLTPLQMRQLIGEEYGDRLDAVIGLARPNLGAVVSLYRMRTIDGGTGSALGRKAVETAVAHELGHVLGVDLHCERPDCIMQANTGIKAGTGFEFFMERFVKAGLDFCRDCASKIHSTACALRCYS
jgi:hypothetical protein